MKNESFNFDQKMDMIAKRLVETNYELEFGDKEESIKTILGPIHEMIEYTNIVASEAHRMEMIKVRYLNDSSNKDYIDAIMSMDRNRRYAHQSAIASVNFLNRICENELQIGKFVDIDTSDRVAVADFAATVATQQDTASVAMATMDETAAMYSDGYVTDRSSKRLNELLDKYEQIMDEDSAPPVNQEVALDFQT